MSWGLSDRGRGLCAAIGVAFAAVVGLVGPAALLHPGRVVIGRNPSNDFQIMAWSLRFWPWVIAHGAQPWHTGLLWAPSGFSTLWLTAIPGPALIAAPVTELAGPIVAYNLLVLAAILAAVASAYALCWYLTQRAFASAFAALVFGLSPYMLGHAMSEHLNLLFVFPLPLLVLEGIRAYRSEVSRRHSVAVFAVLLLVLLLSSLELFVDATFLLVVCASLALAGARSARKHAVPVLLRLGCAYAICLPILVPIAVLGLTTPHGAVRHPPADYSSDVVNLVVPTATSLAGAVVPGLNRIASQFVGNIGERDAYLGIPLLVVGLAELRRQRRRLWPAALLLSVAVVFSLGPVIAAGGHPLAVLPVSPSSLPVLDSALPARLAIFAILPAAVLLASWLADTRRLAVTVPATALIAVSFLPNFSPTPTVEGAWATSSEFAWTSTLPRGFVDAHGWKRIVSPGSNVLVLPTADRTAAQWWQTEADMRFALADPETPFVPPALAGDPTVAQLDDNVLPVLEGGTLAAARLRTFLEERHVTTVVVTPSARRGWLAVARRATTTRPVRLGGSLLFRVPPRLPPLDGRRAIPVVGSRVHAWLAYGTDRGRVFVRPRSKRATMIPSEDVQTATGASSARRELAFALLEWDGRYEVLRVARRTPHGWHLATITRTSQPIWSPQLRLTQNGTAIVGWIAQSGPQRRLLFATQVPHHRWSRPVQLDAGQGLGSFTLRVGIGVTVAAWYDSLANERRLLSARYADGVWTQPTIVRRGLTTASLHRVG